jgi:hypothetical protein
VWCRAEFKGYGASAVDVDRGNWGPEVNEDASAVAILTSGGDAPGLSRLPPSYSASTLHCPPSSYCVFHLFPSQCVPQCACSHRCDCHFVFRYSRHECSGPVVRRHVPGAGCPNIRHLERELMHPVALPLRCPIPSPPCDQSLTCPLCMTGVHGAGRRRVKHS